MDDSDALGGTGDIVPTRFWHISEDGRVQCDLCPRSCKLREGQRGLCFVRARLDTGSFSPPMAGRPVSVSIPSRRNLPIISYREPRVLSFGTAGCNLACRFCQNWDISKARVFDRLADRATPEQIARAARTHGCSSVAFTYNDPVVFHEHAVDVAAACREVGVRTVAVTAGYVCPEPREEFYRHMDAANVDLKAFTEQFYKRVCAGHLQPVLETLQFIRDETSVWLEITTLLIPGLNDSAEELDRLTSWIAEYLGSDVPVHFTAFHPDYKMVDRPATPAATLTRARAMGMQNGLRYVYTGNVIDPRGQSTYCTGCESVVVGRDWHSLTGWNLDDRGRCLSCGSACAGVFEPGGPGTWGGRRLPVQMEELSGPGR